MRELLKAVVSLSLSGSLLILFLLLCKPLFKNRLSKRWQYYIWLAAIARLLLPLSPAVSPIGTLFQTAEAVPQAVAAAPSVTPPPQPSGTPAAPEAPFPAVPESEQKTALEPDASQALFLVWTAGALLLLARKIISYRRFLHDIKAGRREISDPALLDRLAQIGEEAHVRRPVDLFENPLAASPVLLGIFRPFIVLPTAELSEADFRYTALHELTHCRRQDLAYKWLVQLTVCLHWFNPLVWLMERETGRACELACDEAVLQALEPEKRRAYGNTLLRALEMGGGRKSSLGSISLGENAELLKERLTAIMKFKKQSKPAALLSLILAAALTTGTAAAGAYTGPVKQTAPISHVSGTAASIADLLDRNDSSRSKAALAAENSYEDGNVAGFSMLFSFLSKEEQASWLERAYTDKKTAFFSSCLFRLPEDSSLIETYAQRAYEDNNISFFSVLTSHMNGETLDGWIVRASNDNRFSFLSMLLGTAGRSDEKDALEKQLEEEYEAKQLAEYQAHGVTKDGKNYYYNGKLVRVFLDARANSSFYTLDIKPWGEVDVKILRDDENQITGAAYMTLAEVEELFGDMYDPEDEPEDFEKSGEPETLPDGGVVITIPVNYGSIKSGEYCWLGEYTLSAGDKLRYDVSAETGNGLAVGFADMAHSPQDVVYYTVSNKRMDGILRCAADITAGLPAAPGRYRLFIHATDGKLENVTGSVTLVLQKGEQP